MESNVVLVKLWGQPVGYLNWDVKSKYAVFEYDPAFVAGGVDIAPFTMSIHSGRSRKGLPWPGNKNKLYQGLPPMLADSLPDKWGNSVFQAWLQQKNISVSQITPVDRLSFIGSRGMGALEYEPAHNIGKEDFSVDVQELYLFARSILLERKENAIGADQELLWQDLVKIGTSAGGKRPKALVAINPVTGEIRSGQTDVPNGFRHYILKLDEGTDYPSAKIEYVYYRMACDAGLNVMPSKLIESGGTFHFLTERFDRAGNEKIHTQTLAAMMPEADSYEDIFGLIRMLRLPYEDTERVFRQMAFNVISRNIDDHTKNFSFRMTPTGVWSIAPAYDLTFGMDLSAPEYMNRQTLSVNGKHEGITFADLEAVARQEGVSGTGRIIEQISDALAAFPRLAKELDVPEHFIEDISKNLMQQPKQKKTLAVPSVKVKTTKGHKI